MIARLHLPESLAEVQRLLRHHPGAGILAGGTIAVPKWSVGEKPETVIALPGARPFDLRAKDRCGAAVNVSALLDVPGLPGALSQAAAGMGTAAVRNQATIGGNIAHPQPGCLATALLVLDAEVECWPRAGTGPATWVPLARALAANDVLLLGVRWSSEPAQPGGFRKLARYAGGPVLASVAARWWGPARPDRVALAANTDGGVTRRLYAAEQRWADAVATGDDGVRAAAVAAQAEIAAGPAFRGDTEHLRAVVGTLIERLLGEVTRGA